MQITTQEATEIRQTLREYQASWEYYARPCDEFCTYISCLNFRLKHWITWLEHLMEETSGKDKDTEEDPGALCRGDGGGSEGDGRAGTGGRDQS